MLTIWIQHWSKTWEIGDKSGVENDGEKSRWSMIGYLQRLHLVFHESGRGKGSRRRLSESNIIACVARTCIKSCVSKKCIRWRVTETLPFKSWHLPFESCPYLNNFGNILRIRWKKMTNENKNEKKWSILIIEFLEYFQSYSDTKRFKRQNVNIQKSNGHFNPESSR